MNRAEDYFWQHFLMSMHLRNIWWMEFSASEDTVVQLPDWSFCLDDTSVAEKSLLAKTFVLLSSFLVDFSIGAS